MLPVPWSFDIRSGLLVGALLTLLIGVVLAVVLMLAFAPSAPIDINSIMRWLHLFFGVVWIGLLYYLNFVQVPTMPAIPAEQKGAISGHIAPKVLFFFRYGALLTVVTGLFLDVLVQRLVQPLVAGGQCGLHGLEQRHRVAHMVVGLAQEGEVAG